MATPLLADFPELADLSQYSTRSPRVKAMYQSQAELGMANESIAKHNLELQDPLYRLRAETQEAFDDAKNLETRWRDVEREAAGGRFSPQFLLMRLKHSKTAQDDASEALASAFVQQSSSSSITTSDTGTGTGTPNGNGTGREIDDFVREFKDMRKVYHKRVIWEDRWSAGLVNWRDD
ncbi:hypothetical protein B0H14DRAFT_2836563 [Mycena olivaceomarginata]|nr:hypothetical protein B0H14DRAFT_2836563 [Mycena olivaceomarginata]